MKSKPCLLAVALCLSAASCGIPGGSTITSSVNLRYTPDRYVLPEPETARFRSEAERAKRSGNREVCGTLLVSLDGTLALCFADNDSHAAHSFQISHESLRQMERIAISTNSTIVGSFHSHPSGIAKPGKADLHGEAVGNLMMIHSCLTGETRLWQIGLVDGIREARELPLEVRARRMRSASPLAPSKSVRGLDRDVRTQK